MSESDFVDMTCNGELCNAEGGIGSREFESIMRGELIAYLQVLCLSDSTGRVNMVKTTNENNVFIQVIKTCFFVLLTQFFQNLDS